MTSNGKKSKKNTLRKRMAVSLQRVPLLGDEARQRVLVMILLSLCLAGLIVFKDGGVPAHYSPGDVATRDIKAPRDLLVADENLTVKKRLAAEREILPLYDFDPFVGRDIAKRMGAVIQVVSREKAALEAGGPGTLEELEALDVSLAEKELSQLADNLPVHLNDSIGLVQRLFVRSYQSKVVGNYQLFETNAEKGIRLRNMQSHQEGVVTRFEQVRGLEQMTASIEKQLRQFKELPPEFSQALLPVVEKLLMPNLTFNKNETESRKKAAAEAVNPVLYQVKKGEMIVREGERLTAEQVEKLRAFQDRHEDFRIFYVVLGLSLSLFLVFHVFHLFALKNIRKYAPSHKDLFFLVCLIGGLIPLFKLAAFIAEALGSVFTYIDPAGYYYLFPFAAGAMLVRIVLNSEIALVFSVISALLFGALFNTNLFIVFYALVGSLMGAHGVRHCETRSSLYLAGMRLSLFNALMVVGLHLMTVKNFFDIQLVYQLVFAVVGGLLCSVIVTGTVPLVESLFRYTTNIKLLELANMNNPLLRDLMIQAPGTYHHSIVVGNLVEAAAEAIQANPLLARVGAYYHDIGKVRKPCYFIENLGRQENRHDKLNPSMSALILMAHTKDGVDLAREWKLGEPLEDIIRQHHGTTLIKYFFEKAKNRKENGEGVDERDYRYPGPKPQSREAALIMLADAVEAASRTLTDPTPARIRGMVQKIINNIFSDGQLDNCDLTLKDFHLIAKSFNLILTGMFHQRIDYPEPVFKGKDTGKGKNGDNLDREPGGKSKDRNNEAEEGRKGDLKRLGMS